MAHPRVYDAQLRARLLEGAIAMADCGGAAGVSLRALAADAGTSTNAIYTLFGGKEALLRLVFRSAVDDFVAAQRAFERTGDALAELSCLAHNYRRWALRHAPLYHEMLGSHASERRGAELPAKVAGALTQPLREVVGQLVDEGIFWHFDPSQIASSIWMSWHGFICLETAQRAPRETMDALYQIHLDTIRRGWTHTPL
ncbi:DNA-binding transcriptional regulator, AcrR family [Propionibacterium cyclohexanicum]|uniref:DNA-binding transcriptional regulator, AcrR family n=1 Tax=Propionibacterium cyclohexanicum TaxID=64702 RepID=A0A1H9RPH4_9ACTN|nr:TetR/AcrR family transcriptional regulator [Propionibacterium cyclohexanicum]SER74013.1 DNA-binding transcriptional regulator, AcrR family [Propionibacterium cyclohexanicum]